MMLESYAFKELSVLWTGELHKHKQGEMGVHLQGWGQSGSWLSLAVVC